MDSPSAVKNSRPRRSLSLKTPRNKLLRGDPVAVNSPELPFGDSPQNMAASESRLIPLSSDLCSTPVNHHNNRKRSFYTDTGSPYLASESPMDVSYQASPQLLAFPTMSQEMRRAGVDVVWQWNSPKRPIAFQMDDIQMSSKSKDAGPMTRKRRKSFTTSASSSTDGTQSASGATDKATGFYKIREQLLKAKKEDSLFMRLLQEDIPSTSEEAGTEEMKENVNTAEAKVEDTNNDATLTRKLSDEFLNDSDNDENLLIISQETEQKVRLEEEQQLQRDLLQGKGVKTPTSALQSREMSFNNDSFDQLLTEIPFEELLNRNATVLKASASTNSLDETIVNSSSATPLPKVFNGSSVGGNQSKTKGSLNRTQSMPPDTGGDVISMASTSSSTVNSTSGRTMARHESMPMSAQTRNSRNSGGSDGVGGGKSNSGCASKYSVSNPSLAVPISSSTESLYSTSSSAEKNRVCSQSEIARKRQIAQERLKLKQQQLNKRPPIRK